MTDMLSELRTRVDRAVAPHLEIYGPEAPVVKMAWLILAEAEDIARELSETRVSTHEAAGRTGWSEQTLQRHARAKLAGEALPGAWRGLDVICEAGGRYVFVLGSIPAKSTAAA